MPMIEHFSLFELLLCGVDCEAQCKVLDAGSGGTSISILARMFPNSDIDAIVFPGDMRKIESINRSTIDREINLRQIDVCKHNDWSEYDFVLAHLLLGEATKFGNSFTKLTDSLIHIKGRFLLIIDYPEDPSVDFDYIAEAAAAAGYIKVNEGKIQKNEPFVTSDFIGNCYQGILFRLS